MKGEMNMQEGYASGVLTASQEPKQTEKRGWVERLLLEDIIALQQKKIDELSALVVHLEGKIEDLSPTPKVGAPDIQVQGPVAEA